MTDQKVIELIRSGKSDKALDTLYQHYPMMRKMILSNGGNVKDAEDIFQEALIILYRKAAQADFTLTARLSSYLFSVCRFLWKDELKKQKHVVRADFIEGALSEQEARDISDLSEKENQAKLAERVLDGLGERCKELLILFYSGHKLKSIATKMGYSSEQTTKNQKYKCLEGAKKKLKELKQTIQL